MPRTPRFRLSAREQEIVRLVVEGRSNAEIATELGLQVQTVKNRLCDIYGKTGTRSRLALALLMMKTEERDDGEKKVRAGT